MARAPLKALSLIAIAVLAAIGGVYSFPHRTPPTEGKVVGVVDGDTLDVIISGQAERVRLYGIDAPEKQQAFGPEAKRALSELVFSQVVELRTHDRDRYGRTIAEVYLNGSSVNLAMVSTGAAWWYREYARSDTALQDAEASARANKLGLWTAPEPVPPWEWRRAKRQGTQ